MVHERGQAGGLNVDQSVDFNPRLFDIPRSNVARIGGGEPRRRPTQSQVVQRAQKPDGNSLGEKFAGPDVGPRREQRADWAAGLYLCRRLLKQARGKCRAKSGANLGLDFKRANEGLGVHHDVAVAWLVGRGQS